MKKVLILVLLILVLALGACNSKNNKGQAMDNEGKEKVQLLLAAKGTTMFYAELAQELKYFEDEGLDVELLPGKGGTYVVQQVGAGTADIAITSIASVLPAWEKDIDIRAVYQINYENIFDLIVPADSKLTDIEQLKGKRIGVTDMGSGEVPIVRSMLSNEGIDPTTDVDLRTVGDEASSILSAFEKDEIAAYSGGAHDLVALLGRGFEATSLMPESFKTMPSSTIIVNGKTMDENPELVEKISRAVAKATDYAVKNPEEAYKKMKEIVPEEYTDEKIGRLFLETFIGLSTLPKESDLYGQIDYEAWGNLVNLFKEGDDPVIKRKFELTEYLDDSLIDEINNFRE